MKLVVKNKGIWKRFPFNCLMRTVTLQKVTIRKQGYVVVEVEDEDTLCVSEPIPFCFFEFAILCAPAGTEVVWSVTHFDCQACVNCLEGAFQSLDINFEICQSIQIVADVVVEQEIGFCLPEDVIILIVVLLQCQISAQLFSLVK